MILRRRTVELLAGDQIPAGMPDTIDRVVVLDGPACSAIATGTSRPLLMAVGRDRASALRRLANRLASAPPAARDGSTGRRVAPAPGP